MDRSTADWLNSLFPRATVQRLPGMDMVPTLIKGKAGRPKIHQNHGQRQAAYREQRTKELLCQLDLLNGTDCVKGRYPDITAAVQSSMTELVGWAANDQFPKYAGTAFGSIFDKKALDLVGYEDDDAFIESLRKCAVEAINSKHENPLISPAHFDPNMNTDTDRGLANIRSLRGFWLDNDGGDLSPKEFANIFPRVRMAIFNSYSSTRAKLRWRVFIPTTTILSIDVYKLVGDNIMRIVNKAGFWSEAQLAKSRNIKSRKTHGFDLSKLVPSSLFYFPCQAKEDGGSFFHDFNDEARHPLDARYWIMESILDELALPLKTQARPVSDAVADYRRPFQDRSSTNQERIDAALEEWRWAQRGEGHQAFFKLGVKLISAGLSADEVETILYDEAHTGFSSQDRRKEVKHNMKSLRKLERAQPSALRRAA